MGSGTILFRFAVKFSTRSLLSLSKSVEANLLLESQHSNLRQILCRLSHKFNIQIKKNSSQALPLDDETSRNSPLFLSDFLPLLLSYPSRSPLSSYRLLLSSTPLVFSFPLSSSNPVLLSSSPSLKVSSFCPPLLILSSIEMDNHGEVSQNED